MLLDFFPQSFKELPIFGVNGFTNDNCQILFWIWYYDFQISLQGVDPKVVMAVINLIIKMEILPYYWTPWL